MYKAIDLFCGCGGLSCGFAQEGFEILAGVDLYKPSLSTFAKNFPRTRTIDGDASKIEPKWLREQLGLQRGELDCLFGGPPCQGFSKNVPAALRSLDDPRNMLMRVFLAFVREFLPRTVLIENVAELVNAYGKSVSDYTVEELCSMGYSARVQAMNAAHFGVPQLRRRAFFLASRYGDVAFPIQTHFDNPPLSKSLSLVYSPPAKFVSALDAISDLPCLQAGEGDNPCKYKTEVSNDFQRIVRNGDQTVYDHVARPLTDIQMRRIFHLGEGQGMKDLPYERLTRRTSPTERL